MRWIGTGLFISGLVAGLLVGWCTRDYYLVSLPQPQSLEMHDVDAANSAVNTAKSGVQNHEYSLSELILLGKFDQALSRLVKLETQLDADSHALLQQEVRSNLEDSVRKDHSDSRLNALIRFTNAYLDEYIYDNGVRKILADFYLKNSESEQAIRSLYKILEFPDSDDQVTRIRSRINALVQGHGDALQAENDDLRSVIFYTWLLRLDPQSDAYRVALAKSKIRIGALQEAEDLLQEVSDASFLPRVANLSETIELQRSDIPSYRLNGHLVTDAYVNNHAGLTDDSFKKLRLLIDTGASITTINVRALELAGATNTGRTALISTASGRVNAPVYLVESLLIGNVRLSKHYVLGMRIPVPGIDGLLGMDVLSRTDLNLVYPQP